MPADTPAGSPSAEQAAETSAAGAVLPQPIVVAEPAQPLGPTQAEERISLIDVLRGLALFGIIAANMRGFAGPQYHLLPAQRHLEHAVGFLGAGVR